LNMFKLRSKVTLSDVSDRYAVYAAWSGDTATDGAIVYTDPRLAALGQRIITRQPIETNATLNDYHAWRIQHGVPDVTDFELERTALLEANLDLLHGISFDKGCYMGQELTARTHYRGLVKKRLLPFSFSGAAPAYDADLRLNDVVIGQVRSTAGGYGMSLLKLEFADQAWAGGVTVDGQAVEVLKPAWFKI
jgi:folate-binding protein YgfZ